jgi:hypothetical protein
MIGQNYHGNITNNTKTTGVRKRRRKSRSGRERTSNHSSIQSFKQRETKGAK